MALKTLVINNKHRYLINEDSPVGEKVALDIISYHGWDCVVEFAKPTLEDVLPKTVKELINGNRNQT